MPSISAVLPAFNEERVIADTVSSMVATLSDLTDDYEVVVVNDGSRDATRQVVEALSAQNPRVRCVSHEVNRGYGAALGTGFAAATKELIFMTDGDKQFDAREVANFLPHIDHADLVIGYRKPRMDPFVRRLNAWGWNLLVRLMFGYVARDVDCAFKLFKRSILQDVHVQSTGATFSAEFLIKARRRGYRVVELRATHFPRTAGRATGAKPSVILRAFRELIKLRLTLSRSMKPGEPVEDASRREAQPS
ncbi:MAG: glycosyltransferase family 2 protein [Sphingomonadaceae bacterium]